MSAGSARFGIAWLALGLTLGIHVADEALTGFLPVYNGIVGALRARVPWLPLPTFSFPVWLGGLVAATAALLALTPWAFRGAAWIKPLAYAFAILMAGNGTLHLSAAVYARKSVPGLYSAPLLLAAAIFLLTSVP